MSHRLMSDWKLLALALFAISLPVAGCGPPPEPTGTITGTVKSGGEICENCRVTLNGLKGSTGRNVGDAGTFEFKEVPFGDYVFTVLQAPTNDPVIVFDKRIPKKYRNTKASGLSISVTASEPVVFDIDMQ